MNKNQKIALIIISIMAFILGLIESYKLQQNIYNDTLPEYITSQSWERDNGSDIETIYFNNNSETHFRPIKMVNLVITMHVVAQ